MAHGMHLCGSSSEGSLGSSSSSSVSSMLYILRRRCVTLRLPPCLHTVFARLPLIHPLPSLITQQ
jgi:hypothetical protein